MSTLSRRKAAPSAIDTARSVASFVPAFDRWTRSLLGADAPSVPRLRLLYTLHCNGSQRMADLADALDVTPRSITALVDGLETERLVRRQPHPTDRRATIIELTDAARAAVDASLEHQDAITALFDTLSEADRAALVRILGTLETRMEPR